MTPGRFLSYSLSVYLMGAFVGWYFHGWSDEVRAVPEVEIDPIVVPAPWAACRTAGKVYRWVGQAGEVDDSVHVTLICPESIQTPNARR